MIATPRSVSARCAGSASVAARCSRTVRTASARSASTSTTSGAAASRTAISSPSGPSLSVATQQSLRPLDAEPADAAHLLGDGSGQPASARSCPAAHQAAEATTHAGNPRRELESPPPDSATPPRRPPGLGTNRPHGSGTEGQDDQARHQGTLGGERQSSCARRRRLDEVRCGRSSSQPGSPERSAEGQLDPGPSDPERRPHRAVSKQSLNPAD